MIIRCDKCRKEYEAITEEVASYQCPYCNRPAPRDIDKFLKEIGVDVSKHIN